MDVHQHLHPTASDLIIASVSRRYQLKSTIRSSQGQAIESAQNRIPFAGVLQNAAGMAADQRGPYGSTSYLGFARCTIGNIRCDHTEPRLPPNPAVDVVTARRNFRTNGLCSGPRTGSVRLPGQQRSHELVGKAPRGRPDTLHYPPLIFSYSHRSVPASTWTLRAYRASINHRIMKVNFRGLFTSRGSPLYFVEEGN